MSALHIADPRRRRGAVRRAPRRTGLLLPLLLGGLCALPALGPQPAEAQATRLSALRLEGLARVDSALVRETMGLAPDESLAPARISRGVRALYGLGLFEQIDVELSEEGPERAGLTLRLTERPTIRELVFAGQKFLGAQDLREHSGLREGETLTGAKLFRAQRGIEQAYRTEGYAKAAVDVEALPDSTGRQVSVRFEIDENSRVKVREILFQGRSAFSEKTLRGEIATRPGGFLRKGRFTREKLAEDVTLLVDYYRNHGYKDVRVTSDEPLFSEDGEGVTVGFSIEEGPRFVFLEPRWEGATVFDAETLMAETLFGAGEPYSQGRVDGSVAAAAALYTERGYLTELRIDPGLEVAGDSVRVVFRVVEGEPSHVGRVRVVGNTSTKERVIRRELSLYPGSLLRRSLLLRSQRDAFATGHFEDVQIEFEPADEPSEVDVVFRVKEKSSVVAQAGAGYSSQAGLTGFLEFGHTNLFGNGQSLRMKLERGGRRDYYDLSFTEPWLYGRPVSAGADIYKTESFREIYTGASRDDGYWQKRAGGGVRVGFPWFLPYPDYTRISFGYSFSDTRYRDLNALPAETQALLRQGAGQISRLFVSLYRNSTDNPFHPTLGGRTTLRGEFNGRPLGGDMNYYLASIDHRQYFVPVWKPVLMLRWRLGALDTYGRGDRMPQAERFRLGGTAGGDYLRGYKDYYLVPEENVYLSPTTGQEVRFPGGKVMFGFTGELQFPIVNPVYGALFLDAGDAWNSFYDATLSAMKFGAGFGVTLEIPMLGPLGFYYAYGSETRKWITHFAFGTQL